MNSYSDVDASIIFSHVNIGRHCRIRRAIIDRHVHIPEAVSYTHLNRSLLALTVCGGIGATKVSRFALSPAGLLL